jgi:NAD(P)-dependent dehydrogenase (short-subunit alcohol dehydrogenase family)
MARDDRPPRGHNPRMSKAPRSLSGKVAVITGGARGIGQALARALAREGVVVAIGDLNADAAAAAAAELGNGSIGLALDVTDRAGFTAFLDEVERRLGPIDILVNNAGIMMVTPLESEDDASITRQLEINLHAVIHGTREAMRRMRPRRTGHIVNIASLAGRAAAPGLATYCATKHAVIGLSEAVRAELRGSGVEVTVVMPGFARTELASGVPDLRLVKRVTPEEIAALTVDALKRPRFDVWAPKRLAAIVWLGNVLPRRVREAVARAMNANGVVKIDPQARAAYEARANASAPAADEMIEA